MENNNQVNLLPIFCEAFSINKKSYKYINKLYQCDKYKFYNSATKSKWYNHYIVKERSLEQEEYFKKTLGILLNIEEYEEEVIDMALKSFTYIEAYINNNKDFTLEDFFISLMKKKKKEYFDDEVMSYLSIMIMVNGINFERTKFFNDTINQIFLRFKHYETTCEQRISLKHATQEQNLKVKNIRNKILKTYGDIKDLNYFMGNKEMLLFNNAVNFCFDFDRIDINSLANEINFTNKDLEELIFVWVICYPKNNDIKEITKFLIFAIRIKYFCKSYMKAKEYHFKNNKETMFLQTNDLENKIIELDNKVKLKNSEIDKLNKQIEILEKEKLRLNKELAKKEKDNEEVIKLREFIFNLDNVKDFNDNELDYEKMKNIKAVVIGGHPKWQVKMREYLQNCIFINVDNLNFDINILNNIDTVFIYTNYLSHSLYYKVIDIIRNNNNIKLKYLQKNVNHKIVLQQIYNFYYNI